MKHSYPVLNFLVIASKVVGTVTALCGIAAGVLILIGGLALGRTLTSSTGGAIGMLGAGTGIVVIITSVLAALSIVAAGEWIDLHLDLEANTHPVGSIEELDTKLRWIG